MILKLNNKVLAINGKFLSWHGSKSIVYDYRNFDVSSATLIPQTGTFAPNYWPDGSIISIKNHDDDNFAIYMSNRVAIRMTGSTPYPEDKMDQLIASNRVFGEGINAAIPGFTDDGVWFIGMHRTSGNNLIGFFHAESGYPGPQFDAYRNIGVTYSTNNGLTWSTPEKIIAPDYTKPVEIINSGVGDGCVVWNHILEKYIAYYMPHATFRLAMAASDTGASGTWFKWDGEDFTVEAYNPVTGLGGPDGTIEGLSSYSGRNPHVMWNTTLEKWVMVIGGWDGTVAMSSSDDGITWTEPFRITEDQVGNAMYPSLISDQGGSVGDLTMKLYHGRNMNPETVAREFVVRDIQYTPYKEYILPIPITDEDNYVVNVGDSVTIPLLNKPSYVIDAEWRIETTTGFVYSRNADSLTIDSTVTGSPTGGPVPVFIRFMHHGYASDWKNITFEVVEATPTLESISIEPDDVLNLIVDDTQQFTVIGTYTNETTELITGGVWTSSDTDVATVSSTGLVTAVSAGTVIISVSYEGLSDSIEIEVTADVIPEPDFDDMVALTINIVGIEDAKVFYNEEVQPNNVLMLPRYTQITGLTVSAPGYTFTPASENIVMTEAKTVTFTAVPE